PFGWRVGSGAGPAEFANAHVGIEATTYEGLDILFNHAWNNMALVETARPFVPDIVEEIAKTGKLCGKVGFLGVNSFDCKNYVATIHRDNDKAPTITAQLRLNGTNLARSLLTQMSTMGPCSQPKQLLTWPGLAKQRVLE
ncbi:hypothetical protein DFJ43DRAFT_1044450, partial [Lentinula guzmanii]